MQNAEAYSIVLTTAATKHDAQELGKQLVDARMAACVNILPMDTVYAREGEMASEGEYLVLIKTKQELLPDLEKHVLSEYDHRDPEVFALGLQAGNKEHFAFIDRHLAAR